MTIKKIISITLMLFSCLLTLSAGGFSESKKFDQAKVSDIEVELMFESLTVSTWNGKQIVVVFESNKKEIFPQIKSENKRLQILTRHSLDKPEDKDSFCNISLMLPEEYLAEKIIMKVPYKKLDVKKLNAKTVSIKPGPENSLANILIKTQLDNSDVMRTNGNEFLIYLVGYQQKHIVNYIHKLTKELKKLPYEYGAAIGYSMITDDIKTIEDAINEAIEDMKKQKQKSKEVKN